jgi:hypothetical protein
VYLQFSKHREICAALYKVSLPSVAPSCQGWNMRHVLYVVSHIEKFSACLKCFLQNKGLICNISAKYVMENTKKQKTKNHHINHAKQNKTVVEKHDHKYLCWPERKCQNLRSQGNRTL